MTKKTRMTMRIDGEASRHLEQVGRSAMKKEGPVPQLHDNSGEHGIVVDEYAFLLIFVAIAALAGVIALGASLAGAFEQVVDPMLTPPTGDEPGWSDDLDDPDFPGWEWNRPHGWQGNNGQLVLGPSGETRGLSGDAGWADYDMRVRAILYRGDGYGVYFRSSGTPQNANAYIFQFDPGYDRPRGSFLFRKIVDGSEKSPFGRVRAPEGFEWYNVWRDIQINVQGDAFTAYIDGQPVLQASDDSYPTGQVGLRTWDHTLAGFDDVQVTTNGP